MSELKLSFAVGALLLATAVAAGQVGGPPVGGAGANGAANGAAKPVVAKVVNVAVLPFRSLRSDAATDWIGEGIQQAMVAELSKHRGIQIKEIQGQALETQAALAGAKLVGADVVVMGTFQTTDDEVRATGKVLLASGRQVVVVSGRAGLKEVFRLQDDLARQVRDALVGNEPAATPPPAPGDAVPPPDGSATAVTPVPFPGSALEQALRDEAAGRTPWDGTTSSDMPPPPQQGQGLNENPNGWGTPGFGGGFGYGSGYWGGGYWGGSGWYRPPYQPPSNRPGGGGGGSPPQGGSGGGACPPPSGGGTPSNGSGGVQKLINPFAKPSGGAPPGAPSPGGG